MPKKLTERLDGAAGNGWRVLALTVILAYLAAQTVLLVSTRVESFDGDRGLQMRMDDLDQGLREAQQELRDDVTVIKTIVEEAKRNGRL